jgi:hypothetical protein
MSNIGKRITDFYCNGFAGRRYDLEGSTIEAEGDDWLVLRTLDGDPAFIDFTGGWNKEELVETWTK